MKTATDFMELDQWGPAYEHLLDSIGDYGLFYRKGWLQALWPAYSMKPGSLYFMSVWRGGQMLALAPLQMLNKGALQGWRRLLVLLGTYHPTLVNPWPDFLIAGDEVRSACVQAIVDALAERSDWDEIDLSQGVEDSPNKRLLMTAWPDARFVPHPTRSVQVDLSQGYDDYFASLSRNSRNQLRRNRRRLEQEARAEFLCTSEVSPARWEAISDMHFQRQRRLQKLGQDYRYSIFGNDREARALRSAMAWAEHDGCARHYWLDIDGATAAFCLGLHRRHAYFYYFIGINEEAEKYSGGMLLLWHLIQEEAARGSLYIDLMQGVNRLKSRFGNQQRRLYQCNHGNGRLLSAARNGWVGIAKKLTGREQAPV